MTSKEKKEKRVVVTCNKCGYSWDTKSKLILVSCPSCGSKNKTGIIPKKK